MVYTPSAALPAELLAREDMQRALQEHDFATVFQLARRHGISFGKIGASCGVKAERVGRIARDLVRVTSYDKICEIADGLRIPGHLLGLTPRPWETTQPRGLATPGHSNSEGTTSPVPKPGERLDSEARDWADDELRRLERDYDLVSSSMLLAEAGQIHGVLANATVPADSEGTRAVLELRARSALLMGQLIWDASHRRDGGAAGSYLDQAAHAARHSRNRDVLAQALLRQSFIPLYGTGDNRGALIAAQRAVHAARGLPAVHALAALHVSEAHARLGDRTAAEQHLREVDRLVEKADLEPGEWNGRRLRISGSVYLSLRRPQQAQRILEEAVPLLEERAKSQAIVVANLALAHLRQQRPDEAAAVLHDAMDLIESTRAGGALTLVATASRELSPWRGEPWVADVHDRLFTLMAS
ncbi:hypothetical protein K1J57_16930 [Nocardiopsis sp. MT53]|nr:hypothetical protein [Nocardiopsis sp. MT53]QYX34534.1 hypothetical protein K1J57_16930 [Nocardiopsis sp. MT53]